MCMSYTHIFEKNECLLVNCAAAWDVLNNVGKRHELVLTQPRHHYHAVSTRIEHVCTCRTKRKK